MHVCQVPVNAPKRRRWWTCEECGQLWHRAADDLWKLAHRDEDAS